MDKQLIRTVNLIPAPTRTQLLLNNLIPLGVGILLTAAVGLYWHSQRGNDLPGPVPVSTPSIEPASPPPSVEELEYPSPIDGSNTPPQYVQEGEFDPSAVPYTPVFGDTPPPAPMYQPRMSSHEEALLRYEVQRQRLAAENEAAEWALKQELLEDVQLAQERANRHARRMRGY